MKTRNANTPKSTTTAKKTPVAKKSAAKTPPKPTEPLPDSSATPKSAVVKSVSAAKAKQVKGATATNSAAPESMAEPPRGITCSHFSYCKFNVRYLLYFFLYSSIFSVVIGLFVLLMIKSDYLFILLWCLLYYHLIMDFFFVFNRASLDQLQSSPVFLPELKFWGEILQKLTPTLPYSLPNFGECL